MQPGRETSKANTANLIDPVGTEYHTLLFPMRRPIDDKNAISMTTDHFFLCVLGRPIMMILLSLLPPPTLE